MRLRVLSVVLLTTLWVFIAPREALAVVQSLNGQTGQTQTFQNDTNVIINSLNNIHSLGWQGLLPLSRGGTGASSFAAEPNTPSVNPEAGCLITLPPTVADSSLENSPGMQLFPALTLK